MGDAAENAVAAMGNSSILLPKVIFNGDNWNAFHHDIDNCFGFNGWSSALLTSNDPFSSKALIILRRQVAPEYQMELMGCANAKVAWDKL